MKSLCAPVLTIHGSDGAANRPLILTSKFYSSSNGCIVDSYQKDHDELLVLQQEMCVFEERKCNIHGLIYLDKQDILFAYGEKLVAVIRQFSSIPQKQVFTFEDWIQAIMHSILDGDSWNTLRTVVGTVMGDIIISYPSKSSSPFRVLKHHTGMIFGLLIKCSLLFSISDDRSLHMWSLDSGCHLDECYGHSSRPFSICGGPQNVVFTGGQDGSICVWLFNESFVSLLKLLHTGCGVIRSFHFLSRELFFGTDNGFFGSLTFPEKIEDMQVVDVLYPNISVQSFVALSQQCYYILDSEGALYETNTISLNKILQCNSARSNSLKLSPCRKYIAFSEDQKLHLVRVEDHKCGIFNASDQILDLFWANSCLFLALFNFKNILVLSEDMSEWMSQTVQINLQEVVSCVAVNAEELFLGTRKGSVIVVHNLEVMHGETKQIIKRAHGKDGVTDMKLCKTKLLSIGRDGKMCVWKRGNPLQLLSWSKPSTAVGREWLCRFFEAKNQLYVAGFRGGNFILVNCDSGHSVCDVWCGGRRRAWSLSVLEKSGNCEGSKSLCFEFVIKSRISRITLYMNDLHVIKPNLHLSSITSVAVAETNRDELYVTGGIDGMLLLSRFTTSGSLEIVQRLQAHSSSVFCVFVMDSYFISVGGKSEIFIWRLEDGNLRQVFNIRMKTDCRLLSARFISVSPCIRFLVSCSSGRLMIYELSKDLDSKKYSVLFESISDDGIVVKVSCTCTSSNDSFVCGAISSTGLLHLWNFSEFIDVKSRKTIEVEKCGLSALSMYSENEVLYVGVGSDSGTITMFQIDKNWELVKSVNWWHGAMCRDLHLHRTSDSLIVFSVALDCRLAVFVYSPILQTLSFQQSVLLNMADPSSLIVLAINNNVVKCVIAGTSICFVYFNKSPPHFCDVVSANSRI
ncbi:unnamed protein product [Litomosoides sigmodontis]|uniref:tRNA (34-2'-O)-methyltransferase regulator WDR6 n=1 Tax=Litomosoides sigmodontis TaxID=42156 RepID=A0A3P6T1N3_LITSI|nr:unnamed protein product [Litomosoides sigmodontis]